jgi:predicted enzyme related to lactoylglutathione lyase
MSDIDDATVGGFLWFDLMTRGAPAARTFYQELFGLSVERWDEHELFKVGAVAFAELKDLLPSEGAPRWLGYVSVSDCARTAKRAAELGGTVLRPPACVPGMGQLVLIADPTGAVLAAYHDQSPPPSPCGREPHPGEIVWCELLSPDPDRALAFYGELFGWVKTEAVQTEVGVYQLWGRSGRTLGGAFRPPQETAPRWVFYHHTHNVQRSVDQALSLGAALLHGPAQVPGGWIATLQDPQGATFALHGSR